MRNQIAATLLLVFGAIPLGILLSAPHQTEPSYNGHTLTYWLEENWLDAPDAVEALQHIGTNALPFLINGIKNPKDPLPGPHSPDWQASRPDVDPRFLIVRAFKALGSQALPLVPELTRLGRDPRPLIADPALNALVLMGTNGFPPVFAALQDPTHPYRARAAALLGEAHFLGSNAEPAAIALLSALKDPVTGVPAARSLGELKIRPDLVVPALADSLKSTDAGTRFFSAEALMWFGQSAAPALPNLTNALSDPDPDVRGIATNAIQNIHRAKAQ